MERKKRTRIAPKVIVILFAALMVYLVYTFMNIQQTIADTKAEIDSLTIQIEDQNQTNLELNNAIENSDDPSYIRDIAREKLGLVSPSDKIFYISD